MSAVPLPWQAPEPMNGRLRKADWLVADVSQRTAVELVEGWHYSKGAPNTSVYRHGLVRADSGALSGVAMWLPPTKPAGVSVAGDDWQRVLCLTRLVVDPEAPPNAASYLLGRSMRLIDRHRWPWLLTYADTGHGHTGAIYLATNWTCLGETPAGDVWVSPEGQQRGRKRGGRNLSADEMRAAGFVRRRSDPKIKFVHHKDTGGSVGSPEEDRWKSSRSPRPESAGTSSTGTASDFRASGRASSEPSPKGSRAGTSSAATRYGKPSGASASPRRPKEGAA